MRLRVLALVAAAVGFCPPHQASGDGLDPAYRADRSSIQVPKATAGSRLPALLEEYEPRPAAPTLPAAPEPKAELVQPQTFINAWDRVRSGFALPRLESALVRHWQAWYLSHPQLLQAMFERSRPYLYHVVEEIEKRGMPTELAFLPMVESGYNPSALSSAQAAGLWQFIPSTGRHFRLAQNPLYDARRDVVASTAAALDYLQSLYRQFGDWQLALAAYNWGEGAVRGAVKRNKAKRLPTDYKALAMPEETRNYIPKLEALKNIVANPSAFAVEIEPVPNQAFFATIASPYILDINVAAMLADLPLKEFLALNPANNILMMSKNTPTKIVVPVEKVESFKNKLERMGRPSAEEAGARPEERPQPESPSRDQARPSSTAMSRMLEPGVSESQPNIPNSNAAESGQATIVALLEQARRSDSQAQLRVGEMYYEGLVVERNFALALDWFRRAAAKGRPQAMNLIGHVHQEGLGVPKDYVEARLWYRQAAEEGSAAAANNLGWLYLQGQGTAKSPALAIEWFERAAAKDHPVALYNLGHIYSEGIGVPRDAGRALAWYRRAAERGSIPAVRALGWYYQTGQGVLRDYAEANKQYEKAAEQGELEAEAMLGQLFQQGLGVQRDMDAARRHYETAAHGGDPLGQLFLGWLYQQGLGVAQDYKTALEWYRKSAEQGNATAQNNLGYLYDQGLGVARDYTQALAWYRKAAEQEEPSALFNAGYMYEEAHGVARDISEAFRYYQRAADRGHQEARRIVGKSAK